MRSRPLPVGVWPSQETVGFETHETAGSETSLDESDESDAIVDHAKAENRGRPV
jgi:hypothetical protein